MPHFTGQRLSRYLLAVLTLAGPLVARADAGELAPVIDLKPRHNEAATPSLEEPDALIVTAEAMPLPTNTNPPPGRITKPPRDSSAGHNQPRPATRFAAPFDPTSDSRSQKTIGSLDAAPRWVRLAPVTRVGEPSRPAEKPKSRLSTLAEDRRTGRYQRVTTLSTIGDPVKRSVFPETREDRLQQSSTPRTQPLESRHIYSSGMLRALMLAPRSSPVASTAEPIAAQTSEADQPAPVRAPQRIGIIQLAVQDPISANGESVKWGRSAPENLATDVPRTSKPLVKQPARAASKPRQTEAAKASRQDAGLDRAAEAAAPAEPLILWEKALEPAAVSRKRSPPVVGLAAKPNVLQSPSAHLPLQPTLAPKRGPVLKLVEQTFPERLAPSESVVQVPLPAATTRPLIQLADGEPLLPVRQPSPAASDLPAPRHSPLTEEQTAEAAELEAFELDVKPIHELSTRITPEEGDLPKNYAAVRFVREGEMTHHMGYSRTQTETWMSWQAPALCYRPLYFQDINLERHGYKIPLIQPALSAAHFFGRVPLMPYMMVSERHFDCRYTLGHYRPGDYAPYSLYIPRFRLDASAAEVAVAAGLIFALP